MIDRETGAIVSSIPIASGQTDDVLEFDENDVLYTGIGTSSPPPGSPVFTLKRLDPATGELTVVGENSLFYISGIAFDGEQADEDGDGSGDACDPCPLDPDNPCAADSDCDDGNPCTLDLCDGTAAVCGGAGDGCQHAPAPTGTSCGDVGTECITADACDGSGVCIDGGSRPVGTPCGNGAATACDAPDTCDGTGACAPNHLPAGTVCGDPSDTSCSNPDACNGNGLCSPNHEPDGAACTAPDDDDDDGGHHGGDDDLAPALYAGPAGAGSDMLAIEGEDTTPGTGVWRRGGGHDDDDDDGGPGDDDDDGQGGGGSRWGR